MASGDRTTIRAYLSDLLAEHDDCLDFGNCESLVTTGRLDSLAVVKLVTFLESDFAVDFTRVEFDPQRFDSVLEIEALINESREPH